VTSVLNTLGAHILTTPRLARAPIWLYRHRLGWLMGSRVLMLEHRGRASGAKRFVCLEVVDRPSANAIIVASGFGARAQWYRNLQANPACRVSVGRSSGVPARARLMSDDESATTLTRYQHAHPWAWRRLRGVIEEALDQPVIGLPMVELRLRP
jgi:deazaflavin-dependent oxidoreductase (nitroreductase family)